MCAPVSRRHRWTSGESALAAKVSRLANAFRDSVERGCTKVLVDERTFCNSRESSVSALSLACKAIIWVLGAFGAKEPNAFVAAMPRKRLVSQ